MLESLFKPFFRYLCEKFINCKLRGSRPVLRNSADGKRIIKELIVVKVLASVSCANVEKYSNYII